MAVSETKVDDRRAWVTGGMLPLTSAAQRALIRVLALSDRRRLDPAPLVEALAGEFGGQYGQRLMQLASALAAGTPVVDAAEQTPELLDRSTATALRLANESSALPEMYEALLAGNAMTEAETASDKGEGSELVRTAAGFLVAGMILTFIMMFIVPTFATLFEEFGLDLPAPTLLLISASKYASLIIVMVIPIAVVYLVLRGRAINVSLTNRFNPLALDRRSLPSSLSLRSLLAIVAQSGRPIATGLATLSRYHDRPSARNRLTRACRKIEQGREPWGSLAEERLLSKREALALAASQSGQTQAWLLGWSVRSRLNRKHIRSRVFARTISFVCTFILGLVVAFTVISLFMPLVALITGLT
jgi:type II secretory pathway component PulF